MLSDPVSITKFVMPSLETGAFDIKDELEEAVANVVASQRLVRHSDERLSEFMEGYQLTTDVLCRLTSAERALLLDISDHRQPTLQDCFVFIQQQLHNGYNSMPPSQCLEWADVERDRAGKLIEMYSRAYGTILGFRPEFAAGYRNGTVYMEGEVHSILIMYVNIEVGQYDCIPIDGVTKWVESRELTLGAKAAFCSLCADAGVETASRMPITSNSIKMDQA